MMKKLNMILVVLFVFLLAGVGNAGESTGPVSKVFVNKPNSSYGNSSGAVMITAGSHTNKPACSTVGDEWALSIDTDWGRAMYSLVLTAAASGKDIQIYGTGLCDAWSDRESPNVIQIVY